MKLYTQDEYEALNEDAVARAAKAGKIAPGTTRFSPKIKEETQQSKEVANVENSRYSAQTAILAKAAVNTLAKPSKLFGKEGEQNREKLDELSKSITRNIGHEADINRTDITSRILNTTDRTGPGIKSGAQYLKNSVAARKTSSITKSDFSELKDAMKELSGSFDAKVVQKIISEMTDVVGNTSGDTKETLIKALELGRDLIKNKDKPAYIALKYTLYKNLISKLQGYINSYASIQIDAYRDAVRNNNRNLNNYGKTVKYVPKAKPTTESADILDTAMTLVEAGEIESAQILLNNILD